MITAVIFFLLASLIIVSGVTAPVWREVVMAGDLFRSKESYFASEAGMEDAVYRLMRGKNTKASETISLGNALITITTEDASGGKKILSASDSQGYSRTTESFLKVGSGAAFHYGMQAGEGGISLKNDARILGNVYSNGPVQGDSPNKNNEEKRNLIQGDVVSAGPQGLISAVHATSSAYAHSIEFTTVDRDAYYQSISDSTVYGSSFSGSADQATSSFPISEVLINEWKAAAESGGVTNSPCPYIIGSDTVIGPRKINCDLVIEKNNTVVTLGGPIWVNGNITIKNEALIKADPALSGKSVVLIADKASNRNTSSKIILQNNSPFEGAGDTSYILLISMNDSAKNGGTEVAIHGQNGAFGDVLLYAPSGEVMIENHMVLKEVTGYKVSAVGHAKIIYETGLANILFSAGPSGGYMIESWKEVE